MAYKTLKYLLVSFVVAYFGFAYFAGNFTVEGEMYPFLHWFLFTRTPQHVQNEATIRITKSPKNLNYPVRLKKGIKAGILSSNFEIPRYNHMARTLAKSIKNEREDEINQYKKIIESNTLVHPTTYELVEITYNPIKRWKRGEIKDINQIAEFTTEK